MATIVETVSTVLNPAATGANNTGLSFASTPAAGDTVIVAVTYTGNAQPSSLSGLGATWTLREKRNLIASMGTSIFTGAGATTSGPLTVTMNLSGSSVQVQMFLVRGLPSGYVITDTGYATVGTTTGTTKSLTLAAGTSSGIAIGVGQQQGGAAPTAPTWPSADSTAGWTTNGPLTIGNTNWVGLAWRELTAPSVLTLGITKNDGNYLDEMMLVFGDPVGAISEGQYVEALTVGTPAAAVEGQYVEALTTSTPAAVAEGQYVEVLSPSQLVSTYRDMVLADNPLAYWRLGDKASIVATSASSAFSSEPVANAFDGSSSTYWTTNGVATGWLMVQLSAPTALTNYRIQRRDDGFSSRNPKNWTWEGSTDGVAWTVLDTRVGVTWPIAGETKSFTYVNTTAYSYYRINITANNGDASYTSIAGLITNQVADSSRNGRDARGVGTLTFNSSGLLANDPDKAVSLAGTGWIQESSGTVATPTNITLEAVIKPTNLSTYNMILDQDDEVSNRVYQFRVDPSGAVTFIVFAATGTPAPSVTVSTAVGTVVVNGTYHVAATYDGATAKVYVNGALAASGSLAGPIVTTTTLRPSIGAHKNGEFYKFNGTIDEPAYYGTALSSARINAHYLAMIGGGVPTATTTYRDTVLFDVPLAYWRLDETTGTAIADSSGNGSNGQTSAGAIDVHGTSKPGLLVGDTDTAFWPGYLGGGSNGTNGDSISVTASGKPLDTGGGQNLAIELLVKFDSATTTTNQADWHYFIEQANSKFYFFWGNLGTGTALIFGYNDGSFHDHQMPWSPTAGVTYHLAVIKTSAFVTFYVNGSSLGSVASAGSVPTTSASTRLFARYAAPQYGYARAVVDEMAVYPSLSTSRLSAHYLAAATSTTLPSDNFNMPVSIGLGVTATAVVVPTVTASMPITVGLGVTATRVVPVPTTTTTVPITAALAVDSIRQQGQTALTSPVPAGSYDPLASTPVSWRIVNGGGLTFDTSADFVVERVDTGQVVVADSRAVAVMPQPAPLYTSNFTTSADGWTTVPTMSKGIIAWATPSGNSAEFKTYSGAAGFEHTVTGLVAGTRYLFRVVTEPQYGDITATAMQAGVSTGPLRGTAAKQVDVEFTAVSTTETLRLTLQSSPGSFLAADYYIKSVTVQQVTGDPGFYWVIPNNLAGVAVRLKVRSYATGNSAVTAWSDWVTITPNRRMGVDVPLTVGLRPLASLGDTAATLELTGYPETPLIPTRLTDTTATMTLAAYPGAVAFFPFIPDTGADLDVAAYPESVTVANLALTDTAATLVLTAYIEPDQLTDTTAPLTLTAYPEGALYTQGTLAHPFVEPDAGSLPLDFAFASNIDTDPPAIDGDDTTPDYWITFVSTVGGTFTASTDVTGMGIELYSGPDAATPDDLVLVGADVGTVSGTTSEGVQYYLRVHPMTTSDPIQTVLSWSQVARIEDLQVQADLTVPSTPFWLTVVVASAGRGVDLDFSIDGGDPLMTITTDDSGLALKTSVPLEALSAGTHTVTVVDTSTGATGTASFEVLTDPEPAPDAIPPSVQPDVPEVARWQVQDPSRGTKYTFPINPARMSSPHSARVFSTEHSTSPVGQPITFEGEPVAVEWTVEGSCLTQEFYDTLEAYQALECRIFVVDHLGRAWTVTFESLEWTQVRDARYEWAHTYRAKFLVFDGPVHLQ